VKNCFLQVSFRYHIQVIKEWRAVNQLIHVINKKEIKTICDSNDNRSDIEQQYTLNPNNSHVLTNQNEENIVPEIRIIK
jgi:hypothetical protein